MGVVAFQSLPRLQDRVAHLVGLEPAGAPAAPGESDFAVGQPAPDFTLSTLEGSEVTLSTLQGQPVLLNFWATWARRVE